MNKKKLILISFCFILLWLFYDKVILNRHCLVFDNQSSFQTIDSIVIFKNQHRIKSYSTKITKNQSEVIKLKINRIKLWKEGYFGMRVYSQKKEWNTFIGFHDMGQFFFDKEVVNIYNDTIHVKQTLR